MSPEENKAIVRRYLEEAWNQRNLGIFDELMDSNYARYLSGQPSPLDREGAKQRIASFHQALPDLHLTIEDLVAEGDKVVCRNIWRWTDSSSKKMQFHGFVLWRFEGDKIAERWATVTPPSEGASWAAAPRLAGTRAS